MKRVALLGVVLAVLAADVAGATVRPGATRIVIEDGSPDWPYQRWVNRAEVPTPGETIWVNENFAEHGCDGCAGFDYENGDRPAISINPDGWGMRRGVFLHELGHHFDYARLDDAERGPLAAMLGAPGTPWRSNELMHFSPHELFAEAYKQCAFRKLVFGRRPGPHESPVNLIGRKRLLRICAVIARG